MLSSIIRISVVGVNCLFHGTQGDFLYMDSSTWGVYYLKNVVEERYVTYACDDSTLTKLSTF